MKSVNWLLAEDKRLKHGDNIVRRKIRRGWKILKITRQILELETSKPENQINYLRCRNVIRYENKVEHIIFSLKLERKHIEIRRKLIQRVLK